MPSVINVVPSAPQGHLPASHAILGRMMLSLLILAALASCTPQIAGAPRTPTPPALAKELVLYNWVDYMPQSVMDAFTAEYGVKIVYKAYDSQEQAAANIEAGAEVYDVVVMPPEQIPTLIAHQKLAAIDYRNVPNFKNVSPNFRDLAFDPGNRYSIPFHWGTTGLLVRADLVKKPITHWQDLWDPELAGKVAVWPIARSLIPIALKSLGYKANSTNPQELQAAQARLLALKRNAIIVSNDNETMTPVLASGQAVLSFGWAYDAILARSEKTPISYVLPEEGTFLWGDEFVIPANSPNKYTAEVFLNFLLRPAVSGQIVNESYYPMANDAATPFIKPELLADPLVYPPESKLKGAEIIMPLSPEGDNLYAKVWDAFMTAP